MHVHTIHRDWSMHLAVLSGITLGAISAFLFGLWFLVYAFPFLHMHLKHTFAGQAHPPGAVQQFR